MALFETIVTHWGVAVPLIVSTFLVVCMLFGVFDDNRIDL